MFLNYQIILPVLLHQKIFDETIHFANKHNILVVHDFAYGAIGFDGQKPVSFLQADGAKDIGIEIYTLSKTFNMAGWRIAFAVGNESVIETINLLQDHMYVSIFGAVQDAAREALLSSQSCVIDLVNSYESRRNALISACHSIGWNVDIPTGSFLHGFPFQKDTPLSNFLIFY